MEKHFLVKYKMSQRVIDVGEEDDLINTIKNKMGINEQIILQNFDKEWDDWLDVTSFHEVPNRTILRCLPLFESNSSHPTFIHVLNDSCESDSTLLLEDNQSTCSSDLFSLDASLRNTISPTSLPESSLDDSSIASSDDSAMEKDSQSSSDETCTGNLSYHLNERFPTKFPINEDRFSKDLQDALYYKKPLNWRQKKEILDNLSEEILKYTYFPSRQQRKEVCISLIEKYPYLKEKLGSGTDGWQERIRDKMKNVRRNKKSEGPLKRNNPKQNALEPQLKKANRGEVNFAIEIPEGEDELTLTKHKDDMKKENKKNVPNQKLIERRMEITYPQRRQFINLNPPVSEIKEEFPCLFQFESLDNEFKRLMGSCLHTKFRSSLENVASDILTLGKASNKISGDDYDIFDQVDTEIVGTSSFTRQATAAILVLPYLLGNSPDALHKQFKSSNKGELFIAIVGNIYKPKCYIIAEKVNLMETDSVINAMSSAMGIYYACNLQFQKRAMETLVFFQKFLLEITDKIKVPRRVLSLAEKLKK